VLRLRRSRDRHQSQPGWPRPPQTEFDDPNREHAMTILSTAVSQSGAPEIKRRIVCDINLDAWEELQAVARRENISLSAAIRLMIEFGIEADEFFGQGTAARLAGLSL
jgi:hypothetical protein